MKINFDVDIDMADRDEFLKLVEHIPASIKKEDTSTWKGTELMKIAKHHGRATIFKTKCIHK